MVGQPNAHRAPLSVKLGGRPLAALSQVALNPMSTLPPAGMVAFQLALVAVTVRPLCEVFEFHACVTCCPFAYAQARRQPLTVLVPVLVMVTATWKPLGHEVVSAYATVQVVGGSSS